VTTENLENDALDAKAFEMLIASLKKLLK